MTRDLVRDANDNLRDTFATLADELDSGDHRPFGPLTAAASGIPIPLFNRIFVFDAPDLEELSSAVDWMAEREVPFLITVTESIIEDVETHLADLDFEKAGEQPGMAMASLDEIPPRDSATEIAEVTDRDEIEDYSEVVASVFEIPIEVEQRLDKAGLAIDDVRLFLGRVDGDPAVCGLLSKSGDVAGVYSIGVLEAFRRRGLGKAMSWAVLRAGRDAGCEVGVLQSSEMAYPLYQKMGFETVTTYHQFEPAT